MTTDTFPKHHALQVETAPGSFRIGGIAKGAGMIAPTMATMLAFVTTDAAIESDRLQALLGPAVERTFNAISVDGCMSTNDVVIVLASGASGVRVEAGSAEAIAFEWALNDCLGRLAELIIEDGEGATKVLKVTVAGAAGPVEARTVAAAIADSVLVKTAFFGGDANWGRILAAAGAAGVAVDPQRVSLHIAGIKVAEAGMGIGAEEGKLAAALAERHIEVVLDLGAGEGAASILTNDLTFDYVKINAAYRT